MQYFIVAIGGFFGTLSRFGLGHLLQPVQGFPLGTLAVNLAGCLFLGWFSALTANRLKERQMIVLLIGTGFTGSFTTFSTFSVETIQLLEQNHFAFALIYILITIFAGIGLAYLGSRIAVAMGTFASK